MANKLITDYTESSTPAADDALLIDEGSGVYKYAQINNIFKNTTAKIINGAITFGGALNGLTLANQSVGFTISGGTTSKTLTVPLDASVSGTNTGDQNLNQIATNVSVADNSYSGESEVLTAGENVAFGNLCYFKSDGKMWKVDGDAEATTIGKLAIAGASISANATGVFITRGLVRRDSWNWTVAATLYVSGTFGGITETQLSTTGQFSRVIGFAKTADIIWFEPSANYVEIG